MESLLQLDRQLLLWFNGSDSMYLDSLAMLLTFGISWLPLYFALLYMVIKNNETMLQIALIVGSVAFCLLLTAGVTDGFVKPYFARFRPCNDPVLKYVVNVVGGHRNSDFGFFSAHAANTMGLAMFFSLLVRNRLLTFAMMGWSLINCWTRLYLGQHYPSDIVCGLLWGAFAGAMSYLVYRRFYYKISPKINYISSQYTRTGYATKDVDIVLVALSITLSACSILALSFFAP